MVGSFIHWLGNTSLSLFVQNVLWIIPAVQSVHILSVAIILSSVGMLVLRVFGLAGLHSTMSEMVQRYMPWIWWSLFVQLATGIILIIGEPHRELTNAAFQLKMVLVLLAVIGLRVFQRRVTRNPGRCGRGIGDGRWKLAAASTMVLFFAIAVAGRWIAYTVTIY